MFEKEAKERAKDFTDNKERQVAYECGFLDGADRMKEELEKLKNKNKALEKLIHAERKRQEQCDDIHLRKIAELEKENAELKEQVEQKQHLADVRLEQALENYKLFSEERKERVDVDIALENMTDNLTKIEDTFKIFIMITKEE